MRVKRFITLIATLLKHQKHWCRLLSKSLKNFGLSSRMVRSDLQENQDKPAASLCRHVAGSAVDIFCNFCLVRNHRTVNDSRTTKAREKISTGIEST
jgi:hypothetical protein